MGLHRLFWVPKGCSPSEGAYVRYPAEELYAILSLESHRHSSALVGENLGTVPSAVNRAMGRHNIQRMYVLYFTRARIALFYAGINARATPRRRMNPACMPIYGALVL